VSETIITADGPAKVFDKTRFGPTFMAQVAVSKCADSLPLYRQAKAYRRAGVQVNDSTLGDLFHRTAELVDPLYERLLSLVAAKDIVLADETTQRVQAKQKTRTAWLWSFIAHDEAEKELIAYVFSPSRSGETPRRVLAGTAGKLVADAYKGYDKVTLPGGRERAGCFAHVRRHFFDAQSSAPEVAKRAMDFILELYKVERVALDGDLLGTPEHLELRQTRSRAVLDEFKEWLTAEQGRHPPRSPNGQRHRVCARPVGRADALPQGRARAARQQRVRKSAPRLRPGAEELPLRGHGRGRREPGRAVLPHRDLRGERREPGRLHRRRPHPRAAPPGVADRRTVAASLAPAVDRSARLITDAKAATQRARDNQVPRRSRPDLAERTRPSS
jgi:hypothetical protein